MPDDSKPEKPTGETDDGTPQSAAPASRWRIRPIFLIAIAVFAAGVYFVSLEVHKRLTYIFEEDARINTDMITVSSRVSGWVTALPAAEGDRIQVGTVMVQIDDRESQIMLRELESELNGIAAERDRLKSERDLVASQVESRAESERSRVAAADVAVSSLRPQRELAERELNRAKQLFAEKVTSRRQLDEAETKHQQIDREYRLALADLRSARSRLEEVEVDSARLNVLDGDLNVLEQRFEQVQVRIERQRLDLVDRAIKSPIDGIVDRTFIDIGEYVTPGQRLALIHNPEKIWVEANVKETVVRKLVLGQPVDVHVDAYPDETFSGTVQTIGSAATSQFALLPTPNPSGNFTKITQRLPVRIAIDNVDPRLRPGMMVEVKIEIQE